MALLFAWVLVTATDVFTVSFLRTSLDGVEPIESVIYFFLLQDFNLQSNVTYEMVLICLKLLW